MDELLIPMALTIVGAAALVASLGLQVRDHRNRDKPRGARWPTRAIAVDLLDGLWTDLASFARDDLRVDDAPTDLERAVEQPPDPGFEGPRPAGSAPGGDAIDIEALLDGLVRANRRRSARRGLHVDPLGAYLETLGRPTDGSLAAG